MAPFQLNAHTCQHCQCFGIDLTNRARDNAADRTFWSPLVSVAQLREADRNGCLFCATLLDEIEWRTELSVDQANGEYIIHFNSLDRSVTDNQADTFGPAIGQDDWPGAGRKHKLHNLPDTVLFSEGVMVALSFAVGYEHNDYVKISIHKDDSLEDLLIYKREFPIFAQEGTPAGKYILARPPERNAGSEENFERMRGWLKSCRQNHAQCRIQSLGVPSPTRLIRLCQSSDGCLQLKLVLAEEGTKDPVQYAALSYCWGGKQSLMLGKANVDALSRNIPIDELPPTLHDAVRVCRGLAIQYLWVDALCIIQDDDSSKMAEISKMGGIYKGALVTISASSASNTKQGFLHERKPPFDPNCVVSLPFRDEEGEESECFITFASVHHRGDPLDDRGWTLQGQLLSTRLLVFSAHQLQWKCTELDTIDGYRQGRFPFLSVTMPPPPPQIDSPGWSDWRRSALRMYSDIVGRYSRRTLTLQDDRPLAISGIAAEYGRLLGDQYVAGHWASTLPISLLWGKSSAFQHRENYRGPTWSWTSSDTAVSPVSSFWARKGPWSDLVVKGRLVEVRPKLVAENAPYGAFGQGTSLVLEGRLLEKVVLPRDYGPEPVLIEGTDHYCFIRGAFKFEEFDPDWRIQKKLEGRPWTLLELCTLSGPDTWMEIFGLALDPVAGKNMTFTRANMFRIMCQVENLPGADELVSSAWLQWQLKRRNPFNRANVVRVELL